MKRLVRAKPTVVRQSGGDGGAIVYALQGTGIRVGDVLWQLVDGRTGDVTLTKRRPDGGVDADAARS
jgi:hypothetical protein